MADDPHPKSERPRPGTAQAAETTIAAERLLRTLRAHGITRIFANLGTDHAPLLERASWLRERGEGDRIPSFVVCPHEFAAMSAAHGCAAVTGEPQAVLVHVDVGTQNLGAAMHNAHRSGAPILVIAGLAPVTDDGYVGSRNNVVQYVQDVFDQPGIVREYCRWSGQFQPPEDPAPLVGRALERATAPPGGPVYLTATREALETPIRPTDGEPGTRRRIERPPAAPAAIDRLVELVEDASRPLLIVGGVTARYDDQALRTLVEFADFGGVGVVEQAPTQLCFPRYHDLHVGFDPAAHFDEADFVLALDVDVPWVPWAGSPTPGTTTVQLDPFPSKPTYPRWNFRFDETLAADPLATLAEATPHLDPANGVDGRAAWQQIHRASREAARETVDTHRAEGRLTPALVSATLEAVIDQETVIVNDATTAVGSVLEHTHLSTPGSYLAAYGAGLGWGASAAVGVKLARPDRRVVAVVGDGAYVFANPAACAWLADAHGAPTLTVVYNNAGWNAVRLSTAGQHPDGVVARDGLRESGFDPRLDLSQPARAVDAHTRRVETVETLRPALEEALAAVDGGRTAVLDVHLEPV